MPSPFEGQVVKLAKRTHARLTEVRDELARDKGRQVTYDEATEYLLDLRAALVPDRSEP